MMVLLKFSLVGDLYRCHSSVGDRICKERCGPGNADVSTQAALHSVELARGPQNAANHTVGCGAEIGVGFHYI